MTILFIIALGVLASWMIAKSCDGFEAAAEHLGRNMTEGTKGATINAIGSSMPEIWVTFIYLFLFQNTTGFAGGIGTTAGSAVFNAMVIPGLVILFVLWKTRNAEITLSKNVIIRDGLTLLSAEFFLIFFLGDTLAWYHGFFLMLIYVSYAGYMVYRHKTSNNGQPSTTVPDENIPEEHAPADDTTPRQDSRLLALLKIDLEHAVLGNNLICQRNAYLLLALATLYISAACWLLVYSCEHLGSTLGIHGYFVAVVIAAAASSVPDTILSIRDAQRGEYDDALANALGSNIFDICFALGAPLFLYTILFGSIQMDPEMLEHIVELRILLLILTIITFIIFLGAKKITKNTAYLLLGMYLFFVLYVSGRAADVSFANTIAEQLHHIQAFLLQ